MKKNTFYSIIVNLFIFCLVLYDYKFLIDYTGISNIILFILVVFIFLLFIIMLLTNGLYERKDFNKIFLFGIFCVILFLFNFETFWIRIFLLVFVSLKIDNKQFVKSLFYSHCFMFLFTVLLNFYGFLSPDYIHYRFIDGVAYMRSSLGFHHPNAVLIYFVPIVLSGYYLFGKNKLFLISSFIILYFLYTLSFSRTSFFAILLFYIIINFNKIYDSNLLKKIIIPNLFLILFFITLVISNFMNNPTYNIILSNRPMFFDYYISNFSLINFFGLSISNIPLDNEFLYMLYVCGLFSFIFYFIISRYTLKRIDIGKREIVILIILSIMGLFETLLITATFNFIFIIQIKYLLVGDNNNKIDENTKLKY